MWLIKTRTEHKPHEKVDLKQTSENGIRYRLNIVLKSKNFSSGGLKKLNLKLVKFN